MRKGPVPVFGVSKYIQPARHMVIPLWWDAAEGVNWQATGVKCTRIQLQEAIEKSAGQRLPNDLLPALSPGDVVSLAEGLFWINADWELCNVKEES